MPGIKTDELLEKIAKGDFKAIKLRGFQQGAFCMILECDNGTFIHENNDGSVKEYPKVDNEDGTDFYFINEDDQEKVLDKLLLMVKERIPKKFGYNPVNDIQILTPMNRGIVGTAKINESLQLESQRFRDNPRRKKISHKRQGHADSQQLR